MIPLKDSIPHRETPFVNYFIIALNCLVFLYETSLSPAELETLFHNFGLVPARYTHPVWAMFTGLSPHNYLPFFTNIFLHGGWFHLISNMWALFIFGDNVEDRLGHKRYLLFYLLCGIGANLCHFMLNADSTLPTVGASGAISGIMGAYLILFPFSRIITLIPIFFLPYFIEIPAFFYLIAWFFMQVFSGVFSLANPYASSNIAFFAHIGGFIIGIVLLPLFKNKNYRTWYPDEIYFNV
ncbi:Membrane associated serine protease, rhomboid family [Desulfonauticus submarinus]|uniref:Membrane associated serine protease, rhomboid family n=1 Tax=Desulfonauticus submarinus TaxID=206665 RepID=A0A1H0CFI4_9BACT|nr:rhomboid family intramembrane serine protease [Desulfonauticus submarinus]SDN56551.1 Membrane associated serine protease, rhomboid family [Desulfonauticus submarinus]